MVSLCKPWDTSTSTLSGFIGSISSVSSPFRVTPLPSLIRTFHRGIIFLITTRWEMLGKGGNPHILSPNPPHPPTAREALKLGITSYAKLRKAVYEEWKKWYPKYHTHYCHSACKIATAIIKNFKKRKRKGLTDKDKPEVKKDFVKLEEMLFKFEGDRVKIATSPRNWITVNLVVGEYQREFIEAWKRGELDIGEIIVKRDYIIVPFKKEVEFNTKAVMTVDINEKNVTYSIFDERREVVKTDCVKI